MDAFSAEHISMDILIEMTHESLKDIGVSAYGHRHKILRGIKDLQARIPERKKTKGSGRSCQTLAYVGVIIFATDFNTACSFYTDEGNIRYEFDII